jgi:hypothetical protein
MKEADALVVENDRQMRHVLQLSCGLSVELLLDVKARRAIGVWSERPKLEDLTTILLEYVPWRDDILKAACLKRGKTPTPTVGHPPAVEIDRQTDASAMTSTTKICAGPSSVMHKFREPRRFPGTLFRSRLGIGALPFRSTPRKTEKDTVFVEARMRKRQPAVAIATFNAASHPAALVQP